MNDALKTTHFPGFDYPAIELSKFIASDNLFTILLKDGSIIHYTPIDKDLFKEWLICNDITDIKIEN